MSQWNMPGGIPMQTPTMAGGYLPTGVGQTPISTAAQQWDREQSWTEEFGMAQLAQFDQQLQNEIERAEIQAATAREVAQTYANAQTSAASSSAAATMAAAESQARATAEAAQIRADAMRAVAEMDSQTRLEIANIQAEVERERTAVMQYEAETGRRMQESKEFGQPINLAAYIHYMTQGPGTVTPGVLPGQAGLPQAAQAPTAPTAANAMAGIYQQGQVGGPMGVVGEAGPEVLNAIPGGVQVTPTTPPQAQALMQQGVPGMQYGGTVGRVGQVQGGYSSPYRAQQVAGQQAQTQANFARMPSQVAAHYGGIPSSLNVQRAMDRQRGQTTRWRQGPGASMAYRSGQEPVFNPGVSTETPVPAAEAPPQWFMDWQAAQGGTAMPGAGPGQPVAPGAGGTGAGAPGAGAGAMPGGAAATGVTGDQATDWQQFIDQLYGNAPAYGWTGPTTLPGIGVDIPHLPFQQNLSQWGALPSQVQQGRMSMWRALGITPETAMGMMTQAAPTGIAQPVAGWG